MEINRKGFNRILPTSLLQFVTHFPSSTATASCLGRAGASVGCFGPASATMTVSVTCAGLAQKQRPWRARDLRTSQELFESVAGPARLPRLSESC